MILATTILVAAICVVTLILAWGTKRTVRSDVVKIVEGNGAMVQPNLFGWKSVLTNTTGKSLLVRVSNVQTKSKTARIDYWPEQPLNSLDFKAVPCLIWFLQKNSRSPLDRPLMRAELQLMRYNNGSLVNAGLEKLAAKRARPCSALTLLGVYAPGTCFEERTARAILKSKSPFSNSGTQRTRALGAFKHRPDLVVPVLCANLNNPGMRTVSEDILSRLGSNAVPNVYQIALAEPGTNGPVMGALSDLDGTAWESCIKEKERRH